jgi:hypothetical protein
VHDPRLPLRGKLRAVHLVAIDEVHERPHAEGVDTGDRESQRNLSVAIEQVLLARM